MISWMYLSLAYFPRLTHRCLGFFPSIFFHQHNQFFIWLHWWLRWWRISQEPRVRSLGQEDALEKGMATHSGILAWRILWTGEPGRLHSPWGRKESDTTERVTLRFTSLLYWLLVMFWSLPPCWGFLHCAFTWAGSIGPLWPCFSALRFSSYSGFLSKDRRSLMAFD